MRSPAATPSTCPSCISSAAPPKTPRAPGGLCTIRSATATSSTSSGSAGKSPVPKPISCRRRHAGRSTGCCPRCVSSKRPGYLLLSTDVARFPTEPPGAPLPRYTGGTSPRALSMFVEAATELIADNQLTVLADLLVHRLNAVKELEALLAADVVPYATLMWGKSLLDESSPELPGDLRRRGQRSSRYAPRSKRHPFWSPREWCSPTWSAASSASASTRPAPSTSGNIRALSAGRFSRRWKWARRSRRWPRS